jgi:hypothetical protein
VLLHSLMCCVCSAPRLFDALAMPAEFAQVRSVSAFDRFLTSDRTRKKHDRPLFPNADSCDCFAGDSLASVRSLVKSALQERRATPGSSGSATASQATDAEAGDTERSRQLSDQQLLLGLVEMLDALPLAGSTASSAAIAAGSAASAGAFWSKSSASIGTQLSAQQIPAALSASSAAFASTLSAMSAEFTPAGPAASSLNASAAPFAPAGASVSASADMKQAAKNLASWTAWQSAEDSVTESFHLSALQTAEQQFPFLVHMQCLLGTSLAAFQCVVF